MIHFYVFRPSRRPKPRNVQYPAVFLFDDNWNDYGYYTLFGASFKLSPNDEEIELGELKILEISDEESIFVTKLDAHFNRLGPNFCSLGQSVRYYRHLRDDLSPKIRRQYLRAIRDIVAIRSKSTKKKFEEENGFETSLLRHRSSRNAYIRGGYYIDAPFEDATPPSFNFNMQLPGAINAHEVFFDFTPHFKLPHRVNLLIGRNGTGKTQLLAHLAHALYGEGDIGESQEELLGSAEIVGESPTLSKIIAISYSAFDQFPIPTDQPRRRGRKTLFNYKYCGLRNASGEIDIDELQVMLDDAMDAIDREDRSDTLSKLVGRLLGHAAAEEFTSSEANRNQLFQRLSAGQRFIVSLAADILGFIEPQSIILMDEPETHLHPGLLSTLIAIFDEILREYQSFAVIATHSPILLQQIPGRYVRILQRRGDQNSIHQPKLETFGEDLGELTRRFLDLAEPEQDFHALLDQFVDDGMTASEIEAMFEHSLPLPAQIYLDSVTAKD